MKAKYVYAVTNIVKGRTSSYLVSDRLNDIYSWLLNRGFRPHDSTGPVDGPWDCYVRGVLWYKASRVLDVDTSKEKVVLLPASDSERDKHSTETIDNMLAEACRTRV